MLSFDLALTGVEIRFHVETAKWIPDWIKPHFREMVRLIVLLQFVQDYIIEFS